MTLAASAPAGAKSVFPVRRLMLAMPPEVGLTAQVRRLTLCFARSYPHDADALLDFDEGYGEVLQNGLEHGRRLVRVAVRLWESGISFAVVDDGPGFDVAETVAWERGADPLRADQYGLMMAAGLLTHLWGLSLPEGQLVAGYKLWRISNPCPM